MIEDSEKATIPPDPGCYWCEARGCQDYASLEYKYVDEDGDTYLTFRCEKHQKHDPKYAVKEV